MVMSYHLFGNEGMWPVLKVAAALFSVGDSTRLLNSDVVNDQSKSQLALKSLFLRRFESLGRISWIGLPSFGTAVFPCIT